MRYTFIVLVLAGMAYADEAAPKSPGAITAEKKLETASTKARQDYLRAMIAAEKIFVADMEAAQATAMRSNKLDEANAVEALRKDAQAKVADMQAELSGKPKGDEAADAAEPSGDTLTFAAILFKLPAELKPKGRVWDQATIVQANQWVKENIQGMNIQINALNGHVAMSPNNPELAGGSFALAEAQGFRVDAGFKDKKAIARAIRVQNGQRVKLRGLLLEFTFETQKSGFIRIEPAEVVD